MRMVTVTFDAHKLPDIWHELMKNMRNFDKSVIEAGNAETDLNGMVVCPCEQPRVGLIR